MFSIPGETPEQETSWANQASQSPKDPIQSPNTPSPKVETNKASGFQQPPPKTASQFDKPQTEKTANASDQTKTSPPDKRNCYNHQPREDYRGSQGNKPASESANSNLVVPERSVTNTATSPMLVAAPSPQRPLPLPLVVAAPGAPATPAGPVPGGPVPVPGGPVPPQPGAYPVPMVAYPMQPPHYHNGSYAYAAAPPSDGQTYYGGAVPYMGGYTVDPATGSYVAQAQQAQQPPPPPGQPPVGPAPPPCCMPGYPCMYAAPTGAPPPHQGPHSGYDHRSSVSAFCSH